MAVSIPFAISTLSQPLLGAVDTAVMGRLEDASYLGGVAIGAMIFNTMYWLVGFLRVSTSGFSAQSLGSRDGEDKYYAYFRPILISLAISLILLLLQSPIKLLAIMAYDPDPNVIPHIHTYYDIVIWGAPMVLTGYVNLGWCMGRKLVRETLFLQISTNLLNIGLDVFFVMGLDMEVAGVAWATLISQTVGCCIAFWVMSKKLQLSRILELKAAILDRAAMRKLVGMNSDLMIRTLCLLSMLNMFLAKSSSLGLEVLAANAVLMQTHHLIAYTFDGLANATSVFAGKSVKENDLAEFHNIFRITNLHCMILALAWSLFIMLGGEYLLLFFTDLPHIISLSRQYLIWLAIYPLVIAIGLTYYGIYVGATHVSPVRNSMLVAMAGFLAVYFGGIPLWGNHGLWLAFIVFSALRSLYLLWYRPRLERVAFSQT